MTKPPLLRRCTEAEVESKRIESLRRRLREDDVGRREVESFASKFEAGTMGCHEAMHATMLARDFVSRNLLGAPAILLRPDWYLIAMRAAEELFDLHQLIGDDHFKARDDADDQSRGVP